MVINFDGFLSQYPLRFSAAFFQNGHQHGHYVQNGCCPKIDSPYFDGNFCIQYLLDIGSEIIDFFFKMAADMATILKMVADEIMVVRISTGFSLHTASSQC